MKKLIAISMLAVMMAFAGQTAKADAVILADYQFADSMSSSDTDLDSVADDCVRGSGVSSGYSSWGTPGKSLVVGMLSSATRADAITADDYVTFTVTPDTGYSLDLTALQFDLCRRFDYVPNSYSLYVDEDPGAGGDNFATLLGTGTIGSAGSDVFHTHSVVLSGISFLQTITDSTAFRLYLYGTTGVSGQDDWGSVR